jgi:hypothetical protein
MKYIVITSQLVGGDTAPRRIEHYWDHWVFADRQDAVSHGFKTRGSDDFNIGLIKTPRPGINDGGTLHSIWWMDERIDEPPETLRDIGREIGLR